MLHLQWPHEHRAWQADWHQVVFLDESRFNLWDHDGRIRVRRYAGERCLSECVMERHSGLTPGVMLIMKHALLLAFSHPRAKRVCFDKDNGKASSLKPDAVPENHFHLGSRNYAVVSDFADVARIHLRRYKLDATGSLLPTKDGESL
ncbi:PC4 domain-containing protein [Trichonephila clavipes]|nr:PC4 domain-containing protein [Trichonephila clavipes]